MQEADRRLYLEANILAEESDCYLTPTSCFQSDLAARSDLRPVLVVTGGEVGAGKSALALGLGVELGAIRIRWDAIRKHVFGYKLTDRIPDDEYTPASGERVHAEVVDRAYRVLLYGFPVIIDGSYVLESRRLAIAELAKEMSIPFFGIWCSASIDTRRARVAARKDDVSDATVAILERRALVPEFSPRDWHHLSTELPVNTLVDSLRPKFERYLKG